MSMKYITSHQLNHKIKQNDNIFVIDIRESYELDICKLKSTHIPMETIPERINQLNRLTETIIICRTGKRAEAVANLLIKEYNFENVKVLDGGIMKWIEEIDSTLERY